MTRREMGSIVAEFLPKVLADIIASYCEVRPYHLEEITLLEGTIPRGLCGLIPVAYMFRAITTDVVLPFFGIDAYHSPTLKAIENPSGKIFPLSDERFAIADALGIQVYTSEKKFLYRWSNCNLPSEASHLSINTTRDKIAITYQSSRELWSIHIFAVEDEDFVSTSCWAYRRPVRRLLFISSDEIALLNCHQDIEIFNITGKLLRKWCLPGVGRITSYLDIPYLTLLTYHSGKSEIVAVTRGTLRFFTPTGDFLRQWDIEITGSPVMITQFSEEEIIATSCGWIRGYTILDGICLWEYRLDRCNIILDIARITGDKIAITNDNHREWPIDIFELRASSEKLDIALPESISEPTPPLIPYGEGE